MMFSAMNNYPTGARHHRVSIKEKKSFTLSASSVAFLSRLRRERKAQSISLILDELLHEAEVRQRRVSAEQAISGYYTNLSKDEERELKAWGKFAFEQLGRNPK